jgi:hypothetical protein
VLPEEFQGTRAQVVTPLLPVHPRIIPRLYVRFV